MKKATVLYRSAFAIIALAMVSGFRSSVSDEIKKIDYYGDPGHKGKVIYMVKEELANKRKPVLFFTATWCGPCKQFKNSLGNILMIDALKGSTLIMVDADIDKKSENLGSKYNIEAYPSFVRIDEEGNMLKKTDGGAWDENIPENMAPVMKKFMAN